MASTAIWHYMQTPVAPYMHSSAMVRTTVKSNLVKFVEDSIYVDNSTEHGQLLLEGESVVEGESVASKVLALVKSYSLGHLEAGIWMGSDRTPGHEWHQRNAWASSKAEIPVVRLYYSAPVAKIAIAPLQVLHWHTCSSDSNSYRGKQTGGICGLHEESRIRRRVQFSGLVS